jgi:uncharacterized protein (DUF1800 family)
MAASLVEPISSTDWDLGKARHLLNRAGFGGTPDEVAKLAKMGPEGAVEHLVNYEAVPCALPEPDSILPPLNRRDLRGHMDGMSEDEQKQLVNEVQRDERESIQSMKMWWLERMFKSSRPLEEKLALFWHGHFATSSQKVRSSYHTYHLNKTFRDNASGNAKLLTIKVGQSPSMLIYLDNLRSNKAHPNENWARELMELFTLGKGNYTEDDIKNSARAFTGWTMRDDVFAYDDRLHDAGPKTFLGRTGDFDGWEIIDIIFEQPACSEHICKKLALYFVGESPDPAFVRALAGTLRQNKYELKPVLREMFLSREFYSDKYVGSQVKSPAQYLVQLCRELGVENPPYREMVRGTAQLGQDLFYPQNVKGWDGNRAWINANALLVRYNLGKGLLSAKLPQAQNSEGEMMSEMQQETSDKKMAEKPAKGHAGSGLWSAKSHFGRLQFSTYAECADALTKSLLVHPATDEQRAVLVKALGGSDAGASASIDTISQEHMNATLHLVLSMAEYQLC